MTSPTEAGIGDAAFASFSSERYMTATSACAEPETFPTSDLPMTMAEFRSINSFSFGIPGVLR